MRRLLLLLVLASLPAAADQAPRMPAPAIGPRPATHAVSNEECAGCHAAIAAEHALSLHRASFDDASFARGYAIEPKPFCRGCHAPEGDPRAEPDAFARTHGVACVSCHDPAGTGAILAARTPTTKAPHPVVAVADLGTRACAGCHEFAFPGSETLGAVGKMQKTMLEHGASTATCASCHMPKDERGRSGHRFAASRDPALLARSVTVSARRIDAEQVAFDLVAKDVGHAFPTGDLFRRLVLRVHTARGVLERPFGRTFRSRNGVRSESTDTRLAPDAHVVIASSTARAWELVYQRVTSVDQAPPFASTVESETLLATGTISP